MKDHDLMEILEKIAGPRPKIITLRPYKRESVSPGPRIGVYWKYSELVESLDLNAILLLCYESLTRGDSRELLVKIAALNNLLLARGALDHKLHQDLDRAFIREGLRDTMARLTSNNADGEPEIRVVFHRLAFLLVMKLLLWVSQEEGQKITDNVLIGDLSLLSNDILGHYDCLDDRDLILNGLATWEISNPRDIAYSMSRYDFLVRDYVSGSDPQITVIRDKLKLSVGHFEGLTLDEYATLVFGIYSLVGGQRPTVISATEVGKGLQIAPESIGSFFKNRSLSPSEFQEAFAAGGWSKDEFQSQAMDQRFANDTTQIRRYPFAKIADDQYLVLDSLCVVELLGSGLYWSIFDGLPPPPSKDRERLAELWGRAFELYTVDLLRHYHGASALSPLQADIPYVSEKGSGQLDALLDYGQEVVLFEIKASLLSLQARFGRDWNRAEKELRLKFVENEKGKPKALRQLARAAAAVTRGKLFSRPTPDHIFPVLVVDEKALECMALNSHLNQIFRSYLDSDIENRVYPLTVMSIDEMEEILPCIEQAQLSWQELLRSRFIGNDVVVTSVHQALYNIARDRNLRFLRNEFLLKRYEEMFLRIKPLITL